MELQVFLDRWIVPIYRSMLSRDPALPSKLSHWLSAHSSSSATSRRYDTEEGRLAYCISHFAVGANTVKSALRDQARRRPFSYSYTFFQNDLNIVSLGSGPGSDLIGCLAALGAVPRNLRLYAADKEPGWGPWVASAISAAIAIDPLLSAAPPTIDFESLDLNDTHAVERYLGKFEFSGPTIIVMHRVLGSVVSPAALSSSLTSAPLQEESMLVAIAPPHDRRHLTHLSASLKQDRKGWVVQSEGRGSGHHNWSIPVDIWDSLAHKPEGRAEYDVLVAMRDVIETIRWPEIGLNSAPDSDVPEKL